MSQSDCTRELSSLPALSSCAAAEPKQLDDSNPPLDFRCSLSLCLMKDPWTTQVGSTYEKEMIMAWLKSNQTDPQANQTLRSKKLVPNHSLRSLINQWRTEHPHYSDS
eukprot:SAG25_NODE_331_length_9668_cov_3.863518_12_plen_108_part_00